MLRFCSSSGYLPAARSAPTLCGPPRTLNRDETCASVAPELKWSARRLLQRSEMGDVARQCLPRCRLRSMAWCMGIGATKTTHAKRARANTQQAQLALSVLPLCGSNSEGGSFAQRMRMPQCRHGALPDGRSAILPSPFEPSNPQACETALTAARSFTRHEREH